MTITIDEIMSEMESDIDMIPQRLPDDVSIVQLMERWHCGWKLAKRNGDKLVCTGKWEWVTVYSDGKRTLIIRKSDNGKTKKRKS